jgi:hypothetical protein
LDRQEEHLMLDINNIYAIRNRYSNHIIKRGLTYGTVMNTVDVMKSGKKDKQLITFEKYPLIESV